MDALKINFAKNQYRNVLMTAFAKIKRANNTLEGVFPVEEKEYVEKTILPKISTASWGAEYLLEFLAEKTVNYLKKIGWK